MSLKEEMLAKAKQLTLQAVEFAGINCFARKFNGKELIEWAVVAEQHKDEKEIATCARLIAWTLADKEGVLIFDRNADEVLQFDYEVISDIFQELASFQFPKAVANALDEAKKNSTEA